MMIYGMEYVTYENMFTFALVIIGVIALLIAGLSPFVTYANGWKVPCENSPALAGWSLPLSKRK
jgi:hypothetical protein